MNPATVHRCLLCNAAGGVTSAGFTQRYSLGKDVRAPVDWWLCSSCRCFFAHPLPAIEDVMRNWSTVTYADPDHEEVIGANKTTITSKILNGLQTRGVQGRLLDIGCNYGRFMIAARAAGWQVDGIEPNARAAEVARARGFHVQQVWRAEEIDFEPARFQAIVANDVFCVSRSPYQDLCGYQRLLSPGGVLAMRVTNKRAVLGLVRRMVPGQDRRDAILSRLLQGQFHSISLPALGRILAGIGFEAVQFETRASTAPFRVSPWHTRIAYSLAAVVRPLTLGAVDVSPGVLVFAQKSSAPAKN